MNEWTEILDNGGSIDSVYMDFIKAFEFLYRLLCRP
jgi:hypothetical protein